MPSVIAVLDYEGEYINPPQLFCYLQGKYIGETKIWEDKADPLKNPTTAYQITKPAGTAGAAAYTGASVSDAGVFRLSCDMYLEDMTNFNWMVRGSGSEFYKNVQVGGGKMNLYDGAVVRSSVTLETGRWYHFVFTCDTNAVSYTHLDVYKRQGGSCSACGRPATIPLSLIRRQTTRRIIT